MKHLIIISVLAGLFALPGCDLLRGAEEEEVEEHAHYYSPYFLTGVGELEFETISFTDVGLQHLEEGPVDAILLETIAESLAMKIVEHEELNFTPEVQYDRTLLDPGNHLFCEKDHLYIALWRGYEPERWGYSLWSGCNADQEFAWEELLDPFAADDVDLVTQVDPLTQSIVESIKDAHESDCFTIEC